LHLALGIGLLRELAQGVVLVGDRSFVRISHRHLAAQRVVGYLCG
jgi:hypothetical protein